MMAKEQQTTEEKVKTQTPSAFAKIYRRVYDDVVVDYRVWYCPAPPNVSTVHRLHSVNFICETLAQAAQLKSVLLANVSSMTK
jgi:hypothetical protein